MATARLQLPRLLRTPTFLRRAQLSRPLRLSHVLSDMCQTSLPPRHSIHAPWAPQPLASGVLWPAPAHVRTDIFTIKVHMFRSRLSLFLVCVEIVAYCAAGSAPTLTNANTPAAQTTLLATTSFVCNSGYTSDGGATNPFYQCVANTAAAGQWSSITYGCIGMRAYTHIVP